MPARALGDITIQKLANLRPLGLAHVRGENAPIINILPAQGLLHNRGFSTPTLIAPVHPAGLVHTRGVSSPSLRPIQLQGLTRAFPLTANLLPVVEVDTAGILRFGISQRVSLVAALEADTVRQLVRGRNIIAAHETNTAGSVTKFKRRVITSATETDGAVTSLRTGRSITAASEIDSAVQAVGTGNILRYPSSLVYPSHIKVPGH